MKKSIANKWVKALRSGKYKQTDGKLVKFDKESENALGHCCLGVLANVCGFENADLAEDKLLNREELRLECGVSDESGAAFDEDGDPVEIKLKLKGKKEKGPLTSLADANDRGATFKQIATWIEKNYKLL